MSDALICDNCDKAQRREGTINWWRVSGAGDIRLSGMGESSIEGTYCSLHCLAVKAAEVDALRSGAVG